MSEPESPPKLLNKIENIINTTKNTSIPELVKFPPTFFVISSYKPENDFVGDMLIVSIYI